MSGIAGPFYRVIRGTHPQIVDFECDALKYCHAIEMKIKGGYIPTHGLGFRQWSGISVFDSIDAASTAAGEHNLGRFVAELILSPLNGRKILVEEYGGNGHYIVWAASRALVNCVRQIRPVI